MSVSRDRVRFNIPSNRLISGTQRPILRQAFRDAFGLELDDVPNGSGALGPLVVVCRPSQFARFVIRRAQLGGTNAINELRAELFTPAACPPEVDVSRRPNTYFTKKFVDGTEQEGEC